LSQAEVFWKNKEAQTLFVFVAKGNKAREVLLLKVTKLDKFLNAIRTLGFMPAMPSA
jgi:hypothetical protein